MASGVNKKFGNRLVALSSAAVMTVYAAGYYQTQDAAERLEQRAAVRRPAAQRVETAEARPASPVREIASTERKTTITPDPAELTSARGDTKANRQIVDAPATAVVVQDSQPPAPVPVSTPTPEAPVAVIAPPPAPAPETKPVEPPPPPKPMWKDGTFLGWGTSRHGDIQASVIIDNGRIVSATIAQCLTRYACDVIDHLPPQVIKRQSSDVDTVSRATESADAFYFAVVDALNKAK